MTDFQQKIVSYYDAHGRDLPWRNLSDNRSHRFYQVLVSEMMLQQTQVPRVLVKYEEWMRRFPAMNDVASASLKDVLEVWQGLGYSRRAKYLYDICCELVGLRHMPTSIDELVTHKGIGKNTAAAILVYAENIPHVFIETNIRTVFIVEFFADHDTVTDAMIEEKVASQLYAEDPRLWYWALMDYGTYLKKQGYRNKASTTYVKQSVFEGSKRQLRATILAYILQRRRTIGEITAVFQDARTVSCVEDLLKDGLIVVRGKYLLVPSEV